MALDLEAIRQKLNKLQTQTGKQDNLWKPEPGKNQIRIVPYQHNKDNPFLEMYFHYDLGKKNYLSPVTFGEADPAVEFAEKLKATGNKDDWQMSRKLEPKMRTYVPILVRGKESEGVKYWGFGKTVYQELLSFIADPDYGDITDLGSGRDVVVEYHTPEEAGNSFGKTTIRVKPNQTAATEDKNVAEKILNGQKDIFEIFRKVSYGDLKQALEEWLNPDGDTGGAPQVDTPAQSTAQKVEGQGVKSSDDINKAFDDLFS
tara:strand:+ start:684 stop:1460 length:777 start_codon:yes stop_codon:yes gene_type:complete